METASRQVTIESERQRKNHTKNVFFFKKKRERANVYEV